MSADKIETQMKLLSGRTMYCDGIPIKPFSLGEVADIGYVNFQNNVNIMSLTLNDMIDSIEDFELNATLKASRHLYKVFDMFVASPEMADVIMDSLKMLFRTDNVFLQGNDAENMEMIVDEEYHINRNNFDEIANIVNMQNNPTVSTAENEEGEFNPSNEVAKNIAEKIKKGKEKVKKSKAMESDGEGININDMISAVSVMSNSVNKVSIWEFTIYQLYDEFARLNKIDNYKLQIQASMWSSDMEIEHWSEPL